MRIHGFRFLALGCLAVWLTAGCENEESKSDEASGPVDVTGEWSMTFIPVPGVEDEDVQRLQLLQNDSIVTGTFREPSDRSPGFDHYGDIQEGHIEGNAISFIEHYTCHNGNPHDSFPPFLFEGTVSGDTMEGVYRWADSPPGHNEVKWTAVRL